MKRKPILLGAAATALAAVLGFAALADGRADFDVTFSPNGDIAYYSYIGDARPDIFVETPDGKITNLTNTPDEIWDIEPYFSPDGSKLIYSSGLSMNGLSLMIRDMATGEVSVLKESGEHTYQGGSFSPDGTEILYSQGNMERQADIYIANTDGSAAENITAGFEGFHLAGQPTFSPDGKKVVFHVLTDLEDYDSADIYLYSRDTKTIKRLTQTTGRARMPVFSADGQSVLFSYKKKGEDLHGVYRVPISAEAPVSDLGNPVLSSPTHDHYFVATHPTNGSMYVSRGDTWLAFAIEQVE